MTSTAFSDESWIKSVRSSKTPQSKEEDAARNGHMITVEDSAEEKVELPHDVFSMVYLAPWYSFPFWYALLVFGIQAMILWLAFIDITSVGPGEDRGNPLNVPPTSTTAVITAQFIALLIAVLSQDDVTVSLLFVSLYLSKDYMEVQSTLQQKYPNAATSWQFWFANFLRFTEGSLTIVVMFIFIVQSETVLGIFFNFAAIQFVSELDNLGFRLGTEGWFGRESQAITRHIAQEMIPDHKKKGCIYFNQTLLFVIVALMFAGNAVVVHRQHSGTYIEIEACSVLHVQFGDQVYKFPASAALRTYEVKGALYLADSTRYLSSDPKEPPDLHYAYFSGKYKPDFKSKAGIDNQRPVYYEASKSSYTPDLPRNDSSAGFFYYCEEENAWVWTVRAFLDAGAVPKKTVERCKYGWLARSPITDAVTLEETPTDGWHVWTGVLDVTSSLSFSCLECRTDLDCGIDRGVCGMEKVCHCHDYAAGSFCNQDQACSSLVGFHGGWPWESVHFTADWYQSNSRPAYLSIWGDGNQTGATHISYTGRQWIMKFGPMNKFSAGSATNLDAHAYWVVAFLDLHYLYSEPTNNYLPTGPLEWYEVDETRSEGDYGIFGRKIPADLKFSCLSVNCDSSSRVCGKYGTCMKDQILTVGGEVAWNWINEDLPNNVAAVGDRGEVYLDLEGEWKRVVGGKCVCDEGYYGHFCEFKELVTANSTTTDEL